MNQAELSRRVRHLHVRSRHLVENLFAGSYHSVFRGPGLEFDEARNYAWGDDVRFIDWNVSSRMGSPYLKTFREERELNLFVVVDVSASLTMGTGNVTKRQVATTVFALLAMAAEVNGDRVGSLLVSDRVEWLRVPGRGRQRVLGQIRDVMAFRPAGKGSDLGLGLRTANQSLKRKSILVVISDFRCVGWEFELGLLGRKHDVIAVRLSDPMDHAFPNLGLAELEDPESKQGFSLWGRMKSMKKQYREFWEDNERRWLDLCRSAGADTLQVGTDDEPELVLQEFFQGRRGV